MESHHVTATVQKLEIIDELEETARGIYAGCVGYFSADGEMDSCIVLPLSIGESTGLISWSHREYVRR